MEYIKLTLENLETEHICCAISNNKDIQVASKKAWLKERIKDGLVFLKSVERGKCFIEYIPAEVCILTVNKNGTFKAAGTYENENYNIVSGNWTQDGETVKVSNVIFGDEISNSDDSLLTFIFTDNDHVTLKINVEINEDEDSGIGSSYHLKKR